MDNLFFLLLRLRHLHPRPGLPDTVDMWSPSLTIMDRKSDHLIRELPLRHQLRRQQVVDKPMVGRVLQVEGRWGSQGLPSERSGPWGDWMTTTSLSRIRL